MECDFKLIFANGDEEFILHYDLYDTKIALKWFEELKHVILIEKIPINNERFYNFTTNPWTQKKIADEINFRIAICNEEYPNLISYNVDENLTQEDHNRLHLFFEKYRGPVLNPHPNYVDGSNAYRKAIDELNILIHRWEYLNSFGIGNGRRCVFDFYSSRYPLEDKDYYEFKLAKNFAELYINYCEVGKPLQDVWKDKDVIIGEDNIRPLKYYSADFGVKFKQTSKEKEQQDLKSFFEWFDRNENFLNNLGFYKNDPKISLGYIPVARCIDTHTEQFIIDNIEQKQFLKRIEFNW
jgi:hypothetical protein